MPQNVNINQKSIHDILDELADLLEDPSVPKNVKIHLLKAQNSLKSNTELSLKINQAQHELDEIGDDPNLQAYTRTQVWNVVSLLEKLSD